MVSTKTLIVKKSRLSNDKNDVNPEVRAAHEALIALAVPSVPEAPEAPESQVLVEVVNQKMRIITTND